MDVIPFTALIGYLFVIISGFVPSKRYFVKKYSKCADKDLFYMSVVSGKIKKICLFLAFVVPVPFSLFIFNLNASVRDYVITLVMVSMFSSFAISGFFGRIEIVVNLEIKTRELVDKLIVSEDDK